MFGARVLLFCAFFLGAHCSPASAQLLTGYAPLPEAEAPAAPVVEKIAHGQSSGADNITSFSGENGEQEEIFWEPDPRTLPKFTQFQMRGQVPPKLAEAAQSQRLRPLPSYAPPPHPQAQPIAGPVQSVQTYLPVDAPPPEEKQNSGDSSKQPVDLQADKMEHDEKNQTITASGNVMLEQAGRIMRADKITYDLKNDKVTATGHVALNEENGDVHYAEEVAFTDEMKNGFVRGLQTYLADGSRFTAEEGHRTGGVRTEMADATYTPCEPCKANPEAAPVWQIRASKVTHDEEEHRIAYENARFEAYGVPIAYLPYFSHSDGTVKRKSGFLAPSFGYKSQLGPFITNRYYWDIAPDQDATFGLMAMTEEVPLFLGEWRKRWQNASLELEGGVTYSQHKDSEAGMTVTQDEEMRGHVIGKGLWDINDKWRSGLNVAWASDDQYMRQYDFTGDDVLENELYAERFSGRDYTAARLITFQDLRVRDDRVEDQPEILPEIVSSFIGEPGSVPVIGGRFEYGGSMLGLNRNGNGQDMNRLTLEGGWQRRLVSDLGLLTTVNADLRGDFYNTRDRDVAVPGADQKHSTSATRVFPQMHIQSSYPLSKEFENSQALIEPIVALTAAPSIDVNNDIPNEDSKDVQIDASNVFEPNRFPGEDRVEDRSRVTYGARAGLYGHDGSYGNVFLGQSYRLDKDHNPFPSGSGLDKQESDVVGQVTASYKDDYSLDYRFQLASSGLASQRHEVYAHANWNRFQLSSSYLFAKALEGTDIDESREQLRGDAGYYLSKDWRVRTGATQDLGAAPGLRNAYVGLDYFGQCLSWSLVGEKNYVDDSSGDSSTEVIFRIGLKNIGEFAESGYRDDK